MLNTVDIIPNLGDGMLEDTLTPASEEDMLSLARASQRPPRVPTVDAIHVRVPVDARLDVIVILGLDLMTTTTDALVEDVLPLIALRPSR